jgi:hypothetical protein
MEEMEMMVKDEIMVKDGIMGNVIAGENELVGFEAIDKIIDDFFVKERTAFLSAYFDNCVFALIKRNKKCGHGNIIRVYKKTEFNNIKNQDWFKVCNFEQIMDWLEKNKDLKTKMRFDNYMISLYESIPEFREYIHDRGLEQYFDYKTDANWLDKIVRKS